MFQFPGFASRNTSGYHTFNVMGCPIRKSWDNRLFAPPPSLSQLVTSFFASESLGIHRTPLFTFFIYRVSINNFYQYVKELFRLNRNCSKLHFPTLLLLRQIILLSG
jgi:hypothetical protein